MKDFLLGSYSAPKTKRNGRTDEEILKGFDPSEGSLSEGGEYMDDALRMVEQPFN